MVNAVPFSFEFEFCATKVENRGESAITTNPQKNKKITNKQRLLVISKRGDSKQHIPDNNKKLNATFFVAKYLER